MRSAYTAGAVVGTGALGVALLAIRAAGAEAGWAFQLQDPRTILVLSLLTTAITLNLLRVFEVPAVTLEAFASDSFGTGALAAFVATPCAGPFLGVALGTALLLPPAGSVAIFAALGLGLALPFVAVAFVPALRRRLPRPGPWMVRLQRILAIPMGLTALACLWLLWQARRDCAANRPRRHRGRHTASRRAGIFQRREASDRLCGDISGCPGCGAWRLVHAGAAGCRFRSCSGQGGVERSRGRVRVGAGKAGLRLFHRRLVPDLQGE